MSLKNLLLKRILHVWSELEQCYYRDNHFGGDTAEIYAYTLMPSLPGLELKSMSSYRQEVYQEVKDALLDFCKLFQEERDCQIVVCLSRTEEISLEQFEQSPMEFNHRIHLKVVTPKSL